MNVPVNCTEPQAATLVAHDAAGLAAVLLICPRFDAPPVLVTARFVLPESLVIGAPAVSRSNSVVNPSVVPLVGVKLPPSPPKWSTGSVTGRLNVTVSVARRTRVLVGLVAALMPFARTPTCTEPLAATSMPVPAASDEKLPLAGVPIAFTGA